MAGKQNRVIRQNGMVAPSENPERAGSRSREEFTGGASSSSSTGAGVHPESAQRLSGEIRPIDLKDYNGPLFVINKMTDMISHDDGKGNVLRIEPRYHRDHIMPLPIEVATHPGFQRLWRTGRIQVTTDPAVEDYLVLNDSPGDQGGILPYTLEDNKSNDMFQVPCMVCDDLTFTTQQDDEDGKPRLCNAHEDAAAFGLIEQKFDAEKNRLEWKLKDTVVKRYPTNNVVVKK